MARGGGLTCFCGPESVSVGGGSHGVSRTNFEVERTALYLDLSEKNFNSVFSCLRRGKPRYSLSRPSSKQQQSAVNNNEKAQTVKQNDNGNITLFL